MTSNTWKTIVCVCVMLENCHDARYLPVLCKVTVALFNGLALQGTEHVVPFVQLLAPHMSVQWCYTIIWRNVSGFQFFNESYCGTVFPNKKSKIHFGCDQI